MSITDLTFLFIFLPIALALYHLFFFNGKVQEGILLLLSLFFYAVGSPDYFLLFTTAVAITVLIARILHKFPDKKVLRTILLVLGITLNVGLLVYYKIAGTGNASLVLPLGISFFTFKSISYLTDVYKGKAVLSGNVVHDALYLSFFAQITSGPISRYNDMSIEGRKKFDFDLFSDGIYRFLIGFSKKILIANVLSKLTDEIFHAPFENFSTAYAWLGAVCFSLQLFFDFAGYSDMAIGITQMFGFKCPENFNYPYMTESVSRFWRRWHITLSGWFRDYIYIPLGGSRNKQKCRTYLNLLIVWLLTGLWHGISWNFVAWGMGFFVLISLEKLLDLPGRLKHKPLKILYRIFTLLFINFEWVLFHSDNLLSGLRFIKRMILPVGNATADARTLFLLNDYAFFIIIAVLFSMPVVPFLDEKLKKTKALYTVFQVVKVIIAAMAFIWSVSFIVAGQNNPFAYGNF